LISITSAVTNGEAFETRKQATSPHFRPVERAVNAVYPHRHHLSAKVRSFIDLLAHHSIMHQKPINPPS
jgi:DNA-binding transcriptional LysR family regulator